MTQQIRRVSREDSGRGEAWGEFEGLTRPQEWNGNAGFGVRMPWLPGAGNGIFLEK